MGLHWAGDGTALRWFSPGWLVEIPGEDLELADIRFGRAGLDATDPFVFAWGFSKEPPYSAHQLDRHLGFEEGEWARRMDRILGLKRSADRVWR